MNQPLPTSSEEQKPDTLTETEKTASDTYQERRAKRERRLQRGYDLMVQMAKELYPDDPWE